MLQVGPSLVDGAPQQPQRQTSGATGMLASGITAVVFQNARPRLGHSWGLKLCISFTTTSTAELAQSHSVARHAYCELLYSLHFTVPCSSLSNNNNNSHDNVYGAVIMTKVIARVHPVHLMNADWAPGGRQHSDQASRFGLWVHRKLAAVIHIHHHHCYYYSDSLYHPMKGGRLAWDNIYVVKGAINQAFTALIVLEGL